MKILPKKSSDGFTLIELLFTIAIIGILAAVVLPRANNARELALVAKAQVELSSLQKAMSSLYDDTTHYPNAADSYCRSTIPANNEVDLSTSNAGLLANGAGWSGWNGPYIPDVEDPWGTPYYLDEDYDCQAATEGCDGLADITSVLVSCGPNADTSGTNGSCAYDADNVVLRLCD